MGRRNDKSKLERFNAALNEARQTDAIRESQIKQYWRDAQARSEVRKEAVKENAFETAHVVNQVVSQNPETIFDFAAFLEQFKREMIAKAAAVVNAVEDAVRIGVANNQIGDTEGHAIHNAVRAALVPQNMNNFLAPIMQPRPMPAPSAPAWSDLENLHDSENQWLKAEYEQARLSPRPTPSAPIMSNEEVNAYSRAFNAGLFMNIYNQLNLGRNAQLGKTMSFFRTHILSQAGVSAAVREMTATAVRGLEQYYSQQANTVRDPLPSVNLWKVFALANQCGQRNELAAKVQAAATSDFSSQDDSLLNNFFSTNR